MKDCICVSFNPKKDVGGGKISPPTVFRLFEPNFVIRIWPVNIFKFKYVHPGQFATILRSLVGLPRCKKFLLCNAYREWGYPNQQDKVSHTISAQKERWTMFLDKWQEGIQEGKEIIVLGDLNLCHNKWTQVDLPRTSITFKLLSLRNELFDRIIPEGFCQLVNGFSFIRQGQ